MHFAYDNEMRTSAVQHSHSGEARPARLVPDAMVRNRRATMVPYI